MTEMIQLLDLLGWSIVGLLAGVIAGRLLRYLIDG